MSDFGGMAGIGDRLGNWECPSLIKLNDEQGIEHDLLLISVDSKANLYGKNECFIGKWDGMAFRSHTKGILRINNGFDCYAGIPFHNDPLGRVILWLGCPTINMHNFYQLPDGEDNI